ncbi:MAG: ABC transporter permease [Chloroflexi bacterium]|nr:ABC transporter permease [Chloroflexota bacterium]
MIGYIARRVGYLVPTWLGIVLLAVILGSLAPGDPARAYFVRTQGREPTVEELAEVRERFGLDKSLAGRYADWVAGAARGDLGLSFASGRPVVDELRDALPATVQLATAGTFVALALGIPIGILAAVRRNSAWDHLTRAAALVGASIPSFALSLLLIVVFSVKLKLLPAVGRGGLDHLVLPAVALGLGEAGVIARLLRSSMLEVLGADYVTAARAKGLPGWRVVVHHAMRNALTAVVTQVGLLFGFLLAYSAIVEVIFVWPGVGRLALDAIAERDYTVIQGFVVFAGTVVMLVNLAVDLLYLRLDPRVELRGRPRLSRL